MKKLSSFVLFILVSFNAFCFSPSGDSIGVEKREGKLHIKYLVMPGETIYGISTKYGVQVSDLMEINPMLVNGLKVGQEIFIPYNPDFPVAQKKQEDNNTIYHVVQPGETLYGLSRKYNVNVSELMKYNNMDLKAGQKIVVGYKDKQEKQTIAAEVKKEVSVKEEVVVKAEPKPETDIQKEEAKPVTTGQNLMGVRPPEKTQEAKQVQDPKEEKAEVAIKEKAQEQKVEKVVVEKVEAVVEEEEVASPSPNFTSEKYPFDPDLKQVLVIPFDPYLYFSDADQEIAASSNIHSTKVRQVFRNRLNALLRAPGYETIHLLGGKAKDSLSDINKIYSSVTYNYQEILDNPHYREEATSTTNDAQLKKSSSKNWFEKQKEKLSSASTNSKAIHAKDNGKFFGVVIKNPEFFTYFDFKYDVDYYIFINQFEVKTNYEHCLDRATNNYERIFVTHFSIFDKEGKQIAGNKFNTYYHSNSSNVYQIVGDNMEKIASRILAELPASNY